jgi:PEGA domain
VFARALAERASDRFDTALAFVEALKGAFAESFVTGPPSAASRPSRRTIDDVRTTTELPFDSPEGSDRADVEPLPPIVAADPEADLPLAAAEAQRYEDVEVAPAIVPAADVEPPAAERSRSAFWPVALALAVGIAVGYAGGYSIGTREPSSAAAPGAPAPAAAGREFTESAVKPAAPPAAPAPKTEAPPPQSAIPSAQSAIPSAQPAIPSAQSGIPGAQSAIPNPQSAIEVGRLLVRSTPAGARVTVDGRDIGVTPATVRDLAHGTHRVRIAHDGYATEERRIMISRARPSQSLIVPLSRERTSTARAAQAPTPEPTGPAGRFVGRLSVDSRPPGARVFLDGKLLGTTPLAESSIPAGEHAIRLERDGYRRWSSSVRVVANEQNRVTASLER